MPLLALVAATSFACMNPSHYDGDSIRCGSKTPVMRLYGIDTPRLAGDCRPGRACIPGNAIAARDYLHTLTHVQAGVTCTPIEIDNQGQRVVRCRSGTLDLSCAMIARGFAMERHNPLNCPAIGAERRRALLGMEARKFIALPPLWRWVPLYLLIISVITYFAFAADKSRARRGLNRISDIHLLLLVLFGGGIGALVAQQRLDHMRTEQPFANQFAIVLGLQIGLLVGIVGLLLWPTGPA